MTASLPIKKQFIQMKNFILFTCIALLLSACIAKPKTNLKALENIKGTAVYGDSVKDDNVIDISAMLTAMNEKDSQIDIKIKGKVSEVCKQEGCWIIMKLNNGEDMRVTFKDHQLYVPQTLQGKEVILDGFAFTDTTSIEDQKHYAQDAGKLPAEIAKITTPKKQIAFEAKGLVVLN